MESKPNPAPLIVIVGETGSGKTALAIELAKQFNGEIIAADSRTVYKGMDIGTAKATMEEQQGVPHYLIDVVDPDQEFTAADFKRLANQKILEIAAGGKLPIMVGGTGLYVDAVIYDYQFNNPPDAALRARLQQMTIDELQAEITQKGYVFPANERNPRHLMRVIETGGATAAKSDLRKNTLIISTSVDREVLRARMAQRVQQMLDLGYVDELKGLAEKYGWDAPGMQSPGYKVFRKYLGGETTLDEAKQALIHEHLQLAKRQRTWFRRNKSIHFIRKKEEAVELVTTFLNKVYTA